MNLKWLTEDEKISEYINHYLESVPLDTYIKYGSYLYNSMRYFSTNTFKVHKDNPYFLLEKGTLYSKDKKILYFIEKKEVGGFLEDKESLVFDGVTKIASLAFSYRKRSVEFKNRLEEIDSFAFVGAYCKTSFNGAESVKTHSFINHNQELNLTSAENYGTRFIASRPYSEFNVIVGDAYYGEDLVLNIKALFYSTKEDWDLLGHTTTDIYAYYSNTYKVDEPYKYWRYDEQGIPKIWR